MEKTCPTEAVPHMRGGARGRRKGMAAIGELVHATSERPHVCTRSNAAARRQEREQHTSVERVLVRQASLGAHVVQRAHAAGGNVFEVRLAHTKVGNLDETTAVNKNIRGLDVPESRSRCETECGGQARRQHL
jgi:hypothetical protein